MSYIKHLKAEELNLAGVEHEELVNACTELQDIMGLNPAYDPAFDEKQTAEWLSEAMDEVCVSDTLSEDAMNALRGVGYVFPGDESYKEDDDEEEVCETAEIPQEAEGNGKEDKQKPVKAKKAKADKPKKEPKPKKEKVAKVKEPKAPGVIETLRQYVREHGEHGFSIADAHKFICEKFPSNEPAKLLATCRVQLQNSRMGREIGYLFSTAVNPDKSRTIYARPLKEGEVIPTKADKPKAEKPAKEVKVRKAKKAEEPEAPVNAPAEEAAE